MDIPIILIYNKLILRQTVIHPLDTNIQTYIYAQKGKDAPNLMKHLNKKGGGPTLGKLDEKKISHLSSK